MHISTTERRAGTVARHHLGGTAESVHRATSALVAVHSSDPVTPYLSMWARVGGFAPADLDAALFEDRTLWRLHAMRRTLFVVDAAEAPLFEAGAGRTIARRERERVIGWLCADLPEREALSLMDELESAVLAELEEGGELRTAELAARIPGMERPLRVGSGTGAGTTPLSSRAMYLLAMEGRVVRTRPAGSWRSSQYAWAATGRWFGSTAAPLDVPEGRTRLVDRYLESYGPATETDIRWWTGWTARDTRAALEQVGATRVSLDGGGQGFVGPGYTAPALEPGTAALLPGLDATTMGWKERDWYLGPEHTAALFDRNGNAGPTVWLDGRVVGGWAQAANGTVRHRLLEEVGSAGAGRIEAEIDRLSAWLGDARVTPRFRSPLERKLAG